LFVPLLERKRTMGESTAKGPGCKGKAAQTEKEQSFKASRPTRGEPKPLSDGRYGAQKKKKQWARYRKLGPHRAGKKNKETARKKEGGGDTLPKQKNK